MGFGQNLLGIHVIGCLDFRAIKEDFYGLFLIGIFGIFSIEVIIVVDARIM